MAVQRTVGGFGPMYRHWDGHGRVLAMATVLFYLSDGGAGTYFSELDMTLTPQMGMVSTWLNRNEGGSINTTSAHSCQASPSGSGERIVMNYHFTMDEGELDTIAMMQA